MNSRRRFLINTGAVASGLLFFADAKAGTDRKLVHHVFFWLKNPDSQEDLNRLLAGLRSLKEIKSLRTCRVGTPARTEPRDVIDQSYQVSLLTIFDDVKGHDEYQVDPIHKAFVENHAHLWSKVVVYDSMDILA